jgi:lipoate---protein ligase
VTPRGWAVRHLVGPAGDLHAEPMPDPVVREVWVLEAIRPALVLGSTQAEDVVDLAGAAHRGIDVARRRSGGGAVLVPPGELVWFDVIVPAEDPLWLDDVGRAAVWLGEAWRRALASLGVAPTQVHEGPLACGPLGRLVCFAALGAGEVSLPDGRKVVGISQRRTRAGARFQCASYTRWEPAALGDLLRLDDTGRRAVAGAAAGTGRPPGEVVAALLAHLPS